WRSSPGTATTASRCTSTPATRGTTPSRTSSPPPATRRPTSLRRRPRADAPRLFLAPLARRHAGEVRQVDQDRQQTGGGGHHDQAPRHHPRALQRVRRPRAAPAGEYRDAEQGCADRKREREIHLRRRIAGRLRKGSDAPCGGLFIHSLAAVLPYLALSF